MSFEVARKIADAVLYEGYVLYPYRPSSLKNQFRWQFGIVAPPSWDGEPSFMQTECLIEPDGSPLVDVMVRFLQVQPKSADWEEGIERTVEISGIDLDRLADARGSADDATRFEFPPILGLVRITANRAGKYFKLRVRVENVTNGAVADRGEAMRHSLTGAHTLLRVANGTFLSALDSPECENVHTWPVLAGAANVMLSSPIILQDYPAIAPESPGDFFDGTEIDEMLTLRVMTMTDEEKREAAAADDRARRIIERCETMPRETFENLHGAIRSIADAEPDMGGEDFFNPASEQPETQSIAVGTTTIARGSRVRLAPRRQADSMDMFLRGRTARVESVHHDLEDRTYVAVSVEDDPAAGIGGRFFYFYPDELEPIEKET